MYLTFKLLLYSLFFNLFLFLLLFFLLHCLSKNSFTFLIIFFLSFPSAPFFLSQFFPPYSSCQVPSVINLSVIFSLRHLTTLSIVSCARSRSWICNVLGNSPRSNFLLFVICVSCSRNRIKTNFVLIWIFREICLTFYITN